MALLSSVEVSCSQTIEPRTTKDSCRCRGNMLRGIGRCMSLRDMLLEMHVEIPPGCIAALTGLGADGNGEGGLIHNTTYMPTGIQSSVLCCVELALPAEGLKGIPATNVSASRQRAAQ